MNFFLTRILPWFLVLLLGVGLWFALFSGNDDVDPGKKPGNTIITHHMVVDKIESLGKLELTRFNLKDVMEQEEINKWYHIQNNEMILIISGEVIGCLDLTKIDSSKVRIYPDSIVVTLPEPEICSFKINHQESKVYYIKTSLWTSLEDDANFIDKGYKKAEEELRTTAYNMDILGQTNKNAKIILQPILESITGKKVILKATENPKFKLPQIAPEVLQK